MITEKTQIDYKNEVVPIEKWSKDHWSTLAYAETRAVDHKGFIDNRQMRCNPRIHLKLATQFTSGGAAYPTRLKNNEEAINHDDFSCLEDFKAYGLLEEECIETTRRKNFKIGMSPLDKRVIFGSRTLQIKFTPLGLKLCAELRTHKASGGNFGGFVPSNEILQEIGANELVFA